MELLTEIGSILLPILTVGVIGIFIITMLKHKHSKGELVKGKSKGTQSILDSLIPLGMLFGCIVGILLSIFLSFSILSGGSFGAGLGLLGGYIIYEIYSKQETDHS